MLGARPLVGLAGGAHPFDLDDRADRLEARFGGCGTDAVGQMIIVDMRGLPARIADEENAVMLAIGVSIGDIGIGTFHPRRDVRADEDIENAIDAICGDPLAPRF